MKFAELEYTRPDVDGVKKKIEAAAEKLSSAADFAEADALFRSVEEMMSGVETMFTLAHIRHDIDTADEFYDAEVAFADETVPLLEESRQRWIKAMLETPFRGEFSGKYCSVMFVNAEMDRKTFSPEIIPDMQRENALTTEYSKLLASAQIPFEGKTYTLSQLTPFKQDADDARRAAAWKAEGEWYMRQADKLDGIYDELVKLRDGMGRKLGFKGFTELGYCRMTRNCYDKDDVARFRSAVVKYIVPLAEKVYGRQAERLGKTLPMGYPDTALQFRSGNAKPCGEPDGILAQGRKFYRELSPETAEFIDFMFQGGLFDVLSRKNKAGGGYCTCLPDYKAPFIFANFNGTSGDVEVITHEAGHAFANYIGRDVVPLSCQWPTMEACEVHSMSMEFFAWPWAEGFFGEDTRKFLYSHLSAALTFIPYGTMVDHFQHTVYENPEMSAAARHEEWRRLTALYMPWIKLDDGLPFYGDGRAWQRQHHIYENPFYYIDYCLAQTVALRFWAEIQRSREEAWRKYMDYTRPAGTKTFTELLAGAGLESPFGDDMLREVAGAAAEWLSSYSLEGIE